MNFLTSNLLQKGYLRLFVDIFPSFRGYTPFINSEIVILNPEARVSSMGRQGLRLPFSISERWPRSMPKACDISTWLKPVFSRRWRTRLPNLASRLSLDTP